MDMLTLFKACYFANGQVGDYEILRMKAHNIASFTYRTKLMIKRMRQRNKFFRAVYDHLLKEKGELAQSKARIEQLENHIGEMGSMIKFNEMTARIRELEGVIREWFDIYPCEHEAETYASQPECAYCCAVWRMNKALSDKSNQSDKEDGGE